jgi:hypothetical protein
VYWHGLWGFVFRPCFHDFQKIWIFLFLFIDMVCEVLYLDLVCLCSHLMLFKKKNTCNKFSIFLSWYKNTLKKTIIIIISNIIFLKFKILVLLRFWMWAALVLLISNKAGTWCWILNKSLRAIVCKCNYLPLLLLLLSPS